MVRIIKHWNSLPRKIEERLILQFVLDGANRFNIGQR